jgi:hypothetical protein
MAENPKAQRREILEEMVSLAKKDIKSFFSEGAGGQFLGFFIGASSLGLSAPYTFLTIRRWINEPIGLNATTTVDEKRKGYTAAEHIGGFLGLGAATVAHLYVMGKACEYPSLFLIPVATNIISGVYEFGRYQYKKAEKSLSQRLKEKPVEKPAEKPVEEKPKEYM